MATRKLAFVTTKAQGVSENTYVILTFTPVDEADLYSKQRTSTRPIFSDYTDCRGLLIVPVVWKVNANIELKDSDTDPLR
jgi:hypothetical protein